MTVAPRAFRVSRGGVEHRLTASSEEELLDALSGYVLLFDAAEMLAAQAWAGEEAVHGFIEVWAV